MAEPTQIIVARRSESWPNRHILSRGETRPFAGFGITAFSRREFVKTPKILRDFGKFDSRRERENDILASGFWENAKIIARGPEDITFVFLGDAGS